MSRGVDEIRCRVLSMCKNRSHTVRHKRGVKVHSVNKKVLVSFQEEIRLQLHVKQGGETYQS